MTPSQTQVAVLGLGIIGSRCADNLAKAGWPVASWNRTPKGTDQEVASAAEAIRGATIVSIYLKDSPAVREVVGGAAQALCAGQIILNHATLDLETTRWLAALCAEKGCRFLDCPFTGSKVAAGNGALAYYIGGDAALAEELDEFLSATSTSRLHCGGIGAATVIKLATNLLSSSIVQATAEALAITRGNGVDPAVLQEAISRNVNSCKLIDMKLPQMLAGDYEAHFSLANMAKDSRYMLELAKAAGIETPAIAAVSRRMHELSEAGLGDLDFAALGKPYLEKGAGGCD